ncbi:hypothetical protein EJ05DRAFT_486947 [Pseudovirgaria hyperparasitica]|uniref:Uncharacterized protein n=1 Tax=Pseudovirgaria hyperparasitica TaxID=470096 RepID=A0A6A6W1Z0_9PEZI|nr:uncharacterized protein EJ05DRAFT_486947 [Pseudovirgaria hyperparasitica]KAF2756938.1 hypothetical protein EJ05DRAFT_486947 [Pseudovirgaria hyperparasitica]
MDDFEIDLTGVGTPMMQDNVELVDEISYDADLPDAQASAQSPQSVAMDHDDAEEMADALLEDAEYDLEHNEHNLDLQDVEVDTEFVPQTADASLVDAYQHELQFTGNLEYETPQDLAGSMENASVPEIANASMSVSGSMDAAQVTWVTANDETAQSADALPAPANNHHHPDPEISYDPGDPDDGNLVDPSTRQSLPRPDAEAESTSQTNTHQDLHSEGDSSSKLENKPETSNEGATTDSYSKSHERILDNCESHEGHRDEDIPNVDSVTQVVDGNSNDTSSLNTAPEPKQVESLHPILADWDDERDWLFQPNASEEHQGFYLEQSALAHESFPILFAELRNALGGDLGNTEELEIDIPVFNTIVREDACKDACTLADFVNMYVQLHELDGNSTPGPFEVVLRRRTRFATRLAQIREAISSKQGLSQLKFLRDSTTVDSSEYLEEDDDQKSDVSSSEGEELYNATEAKASMKKPELHSDDVDHAGEEEEQEEQEEDGTALIDEADAAKSVLITELVDANEVTGDSLTEQYEEHSEHDTENVLPGEHDEVHWQDDGLDETENNNTASETAPPELDEVTLEADSENHSRKPSTPNNVLLTDPHAEGDSYSEQYLETSHTKEIQHEDHGDLINFGNENEVCENTSATTEEHSGAVERIVTPLNDSVPAELESKNESTTAQLLAEDDLIDYDDEEDEQAAAQADSPSATSTPTVQGDEPSIQIQTPEKETSSPPYKRSRESDEDNLRGDPDIKKHKSG